MGTFVTKATSVLMVPMVTNVTTGTFVTNATRVIMVTNVTMGTFVTKATSVRMVPMVTNVTTGNFVTSSTGVMVRMVTNVTMGTFVTKATCPRSNAPFKVRSLSQPVQLADLRMFFTLAAFRPAAFFMSPSNKRVKFRKMCIALLQWCVSFI
jgi:hypothetical protein